MIRPIGESLRPNTVIITPVVLVEGLRGGTTETYPGEGTTYEKVLVTSRGETAIKSKRAPGGGAELAKVTHTVFMNVDPGVSANAKVEWVDRGRVLKTLGPARPEGGQDRAFGLDCEETV